MSIGVVSSHYVAAGGGGGTGYSAAVLADSPMGYWRLGETSGTTMVDSSTGGHNGAYWGTYTLGSPGLTAGDTAVTFSAGRGTVFYGTWMDGGTSLAVDALIKPSSISGSYNFIVNASDAGTFGPWWLVLHAGKLEFGMCTTTGSFVQATGATTLTAGTTYHVGAIYDGTNARVYVNGAQDASIAQTGALRVTSNDLWIGNWAYSNLPFVGVVDEVAMYHSLTPARMAAHAAAV